MGERGSDSDSEDTFVLEERDVSATKDAGSDCIQALPEGSKIDRYVVREPLGAGGMGVVYRAHDPKLDRDIAVKLLRRHKYLIDEREHDRLLSEARSLARLSHPNIAEVFDVGRFNSQIYVALALIEGPTLRQWAAKRPSTEDVLHLICQAGEGLAAAHEAGLVHRDFKPANVMIDPSTRTAIVLDFGIAAPTGPGAVSDTAIDSRLSEASADDVVVMGTPAYMAPEQAMAAPADPAADQFSFFVSLYELLHGVRPFADYGAERRRAIQSGRFESGPGSDSVPAWLAPIVQRGLAFEPDARWPSMRVALETLRRRGRSRKPYVGAAVGAATLIAGGWVWASTPGPARCDDPDALEDIWNDTERSKIESALLATQAPYASFASRRLTEELDQYGEDWLVARTYACGLAAKEPELFDRAMVCLDLRRRALRGLVNEVGTADAQLVERAAGLVSTLTTPEECVRDGSPELSPLPTDPAVRDKVLGAYQLLDEALLADAAGRYTVGLEKAQAAVQASKPLGHAPLLLEATAQLGRALIRLDQGDEGRERLAESYLLASETGSYRQAVIIAAELAVEESQARSDGEAAMKWLRHGQGALAHLPDDTQMRSLLLRAEGSVELSRGDAAKAHEALREARMLIEVDGGRPDADTAAAMSSEAIALVELGRTTEGIELSERATKISRERLGDDHPRVADYEQTLAFACIRANRYDEAIEHGNAALQIREAALGPDHPLVANALNTVGGVYMNTEQLEQAAEAFGRAASIWGANEDAPDPRLAQALHNLGDIRAKQGRVDEAIEHARRSLELAEKSLGPDNPTLTFPLLGLARAYLANENAAQALPIALRARALVDSASAIRPNAWSVYLVAARAHWGTGDHVKARETATAAVALLDDMPDLDHDAKKKVEDWLEQHPLPSE